MLCSDSSRLLISAQHIQSGPDTVDVLSYATHRVVVQTSCQCRNSFPMAANSSSANMANIITALGNAFKDPSGATMSNDRLAAVLLQNMNQLTDLAKQGKLNQQQIMQVRQPASSFIICEFPAHHFFSFSSFVRQLRDYADKHKPATTKQVRCFLRPCFFFQLQKPYSYVPPPTPVVTVARGQRSPPGKFLGPQGNDGKLARPNARRELQLKGHIPDQPDAEPNEPRSRPVGGCSRWASNSHGWYDGGPRSGWVFFPLSADCFCFWRGKWADVCACGGFKVRPRR